MEVETAQKKEFEAEIMEDEAGQKTVELRRVITSTHTLDDLQQELLKVESQLLTLKQTYNKNVSELEGARSRILEGINAFQEVK